MPLKIGSRKYRKPEERQGQSGRRSRQAPVRRFRRLSKGHRCRSRSGHSGHLAGLPPHSLGSRGKSWQTRLHGKAGRRRRRRCAGGSGRRRGSQEENLAIGVGLQRHHQNKYIETIKRLQDGASATSSTRVYWNGSGVWVKPRIPGETEMTYQMRNWYYFNWLCGDHIVEQHIHNLDVINWLTGKFRPRPRAWAAARCGSARNTARSSIITPSSSLTAPATVHA